MALSKADEQFQLDCYGLALDSFDMVLNVQWLEFLGPILWDFTRRTITFIRDGHEVCWSVMDVAPSGPGILATDADAKAELVHCFDELFSEPADLLPQRARSH
jgi:hypothetical protein